MQKSSVNKTITVGRMGADVDLKYTTSQVAVANISLATTESVKGQDGQYQDKTEWIKIVVFAKQAEFISNYAGKGSLLYIEGRLQTRSWTDRDDIKRYVTEVVAQTVTLLSSKPNSNDNSQGSSPQGGNPFGGEEDEPLPF